MISSSFSVRLFTVVPNRSFNLRSCSFLFNFFWGDETWEKCVLFCYSKTRVRKEIHVRPGNPCWTSVSFSAENFPSRSWTALDLFCKHLATLGAREGNLLFSSTSGNLTAFNISACSSSPAALSDPNSSSDDSASPASPGNGKNLDVMDC